jgi:hypothetical protein
MSKQYTPAETRRKLKNLILKFKTSLPEVLMRFLRIPPFFNIVFWHYCKMLGLVLPSLSVPEALTVRVTLTTSLDCVIKKNTAHSFLPPNTPMKG